MLIETRTDAGFIRDGVAEIELHGRLTLSSWSRLLLVAELAASDPFVEVIHVRGNFDSPAVVDDRQEFWDAGRDMLRRWLALPIPTVAVVRGPACGAGWEFLQAFDLRLAVATAGSWFAAPTKPAWVAARKPRRLTAREAVRAGVLDDAYCERVAGIETRLHLDRLLRRPAKRKPRIDLSGSWALRSAFIHVEVGEVEPEASALRPTTVAILDGGLLGSELAVETILRGGTATIGDESQRAETERLLSEAVRRGRATPLEAEQARKRLHFGLESPTLAEARRIVTTRPAAVEFLRRQLHPWAIIIDLAGPDARAWLRELSLTIPPATIAARYTAATVGRKIAS